jgi:hypothetical protein
MVRGGHDVVAKTWVSLAPMAKPSLAPRQIACQGAGEKKTLTRPVWNVQDVECLEICEVESN